MRLANLNGRAVLLSVDGTYAVDVQRASNSVTSDPQAVYADWVDFTSWAVGVDVVIHPDAVAVDTGDLDAPVPRPAQVFGIGLNYADHAAEAGLQLPEHPMVFTKFPSSLVGPDSTVRLSGDRVDWEAELVVVIGSGGRNIAEDAAWDAVAGLTVGQDLSDRTVQTRGNLAQFNLGKSFAGYSPTGPPS
jgi:2,4-diketo-3-deoxy-L-fuconate hydrolase